MTNAELSERIAWLAQRVMVAPVPEGVVALSAFRDAKHYADMLGQAVDRLERGRDPL